MNVTILIKGRVEKIERFFSQHSLYLFVFSLIIFGVKVNCKCFPHIFWWMLHTRLSNSCRSKATGILTNITFVLLLFVPVFCPSNNFRPVKSVKYTLNSILLFVSKRAIVSFLANRIATKFTNFSDNRLKNRLVALSQIWTYVCIRYWDLL